MNIKLRTAQYGWLICEFMYLRGKYETEYQKKQEYKSKISSISGALFKQEQAPKQKQLQWVTILLKSLLARKKNIYQFVMIKFKQHV